MNGGVFGPEYARSYDVLYEEKDYEAECDLIEEVFKRQAVRKVNSILDLGCGTGGHAIPLARRGYHVTGVDRSESMLAIARQKAEAQTWDEDTHAPEFVEGDLRSLDLGRQFDAVCMMFTVLGYQVTNVDLCSALESVRRHLNPGALFVGDVWYGPAVLTLRPSDRVRVISREGSDLIRASLVSINTRRHLLTVHYQMWEVRDQNMVMHMEEDHTVRFFFPLELEHHLDVAGLEPVGLYPFPELAGEPSDNTWNVLVCGRATSG